MWYNELPQHVQAHQIGVDILDRASASQAECCRDNTLGHTKSIVTMGQEADNKSKTV